MNSDTFSGNSGSVAPGLGPVPPPPPPPPGIGQIPSLRINTAETQGSRRPPPPSDPYEPPAAIQNAMMTKDKKPFTYTPGMGGKLDLSQIRSPRMARRVAKNANDEGIEGPPKSALEPKAPLPPGSANLFIQPQVAVPVFPSTIPSPPAPNRTPNVQINRVPPAVPERHSSVPEQPRMKVETKIIPVTNCSQPNSPETPTSPTSPTQVTLTKAPTPWLQNKNKPQDELPEWARRSNVNRSQETSPESPLSPPVYIPVQQQQPQPFQQKQQPQQFQNRQTQPPQQQFQSKPLPQQQPSRPQSSPQERTVPLRIEDRPSVFSVKQEPGHHQFENTQPHHQSRWYQQPQSQPQPVRQDPQQSGGYIIPIMVEGANRTSNGQSISSPQPASYSQPQIRIVPIDNQNSKMNAQRGPAVAQQEPGPIQSKSFRVLQKITDTDADEIDGDQLRKLQLTEEDKLLMNKFKEQVDGDTYLHQEADPRYRGSAIPSRAFRYLQNMTDSGEVTTAGAPRAVNSAIKKQNRNSKSFEEVQANLPASEQTVPEPKKYTGSAIPSRSFRILQAMTTPEAIVTQENWQADFVCQTENNIPVNQQAIFYPPCPTNFWSTDGGWWSYHPIPPCIPIPPNSSCIPNSPNTCISNIALNKPSSTSNSTPNNQPYTFYNDEDGVTYVCYPLFNQNHPLLQNAEQEKQFLPENLNGGTVSLNEPKALNENFQNSFPINSDQFGNNSPSNSLSPWNDNFDSSNDKPNHLEPWSNLSCDNLDPKSQEETRIIVTPCTDDENDSASDEESCKFSEKTNSSLSSSSDDSESFLAYSTGLNPQTNLQQSLSATTLSEDTCEQSLSSDKLNSDSYFDEEYKDNFYEGYKVEEECKMEYGTQEGYKMECGTQEGCKMECGIQERCKIPREVEIKEDGWNIPEEEFEIETEDKIPEEACKVLGNSYKIYDLPGDESEVRTADKTADESMVQSNKYKMLKQFWYNIPGDGSRVQGDSCKMYNLPDDECQIRTEDKAEGKTADKFTVQSNKYKMLKNTFYKIPGGECDVQRDKGTFCKDYETDHEVEMHVPHQLTIIPEDSVPNETTDDGDTINVRLPLRFKFPLSENNHVTVGDQKASTKDSEIHVDFTLKRSRQITRDTEVDFTLQNTGENPQNTETGVNIENTLSEKSIEISTNLEPSHKESDTKTELIKNEIEPKITENRIKHETKQISDENQVFYESHVSDVVYDLANIYKSESVYDLTTSEKIYNFPKETGTFDSKLTHQNEEIEDEVIQNDVSFSQKSSNLLSVQNSREETDDEDSGVTSDMSRIISEVDTDSECCTTTRKQSKYQRTQTHSRLFKLLTNDSDDQNPRREHLNLPLQSNSIADDNYCSNYSSGMTSPDTSPVYESEKSTQDCYYQMWKLTKHEMDTNILPSMAHKVLDSQKPHWTYKVNVLCPRIKSSKNIPRDFKITTNAKSLDPVNLSYPENPLRNSHC